MQLYKLTINSVPGSLGLCSRRAVYSSGDVSAYKSFNTKLVQHTANLKPRIISFYLDITVFTGLYIILNMSDMKLRASLMLNIVPETILIRREWSKIFTIRRWDYLFWGINDSYTSSELCILSESCYLKAFLHTFRGRQWLHSSHVSTGVWRSVTELTCVYQLCLKLRMCGRLEGSKG